MNTDDLLLDLRMALEQLENALQIPAESDLIKAGCIQYFDFCFELAWKTVKSVAADNGAEFLSPKSCLKHAYHHDWIADETLRLDML